MKSPSGWSIFLFAIMQFVIAIILIVAMVGRLTINTYPFIHFYLTFMILLVVYIVSLIIAILTPVHPSKGIWFAWLLRWSLAFVFAPAIILSLNVWNLSPTIMPTMYPWVRMGRPWEAVFEIIFAIISLFLLVLLQSKFQKDKR